ncbi:MAG: class I SAM-dependent methyltransferase [Myxococcales bacterium]|nr:class I SAM-dependent methyltransferase [Myxococcales bacterium]
MSCAQSVTHDRAIRGRFHAWFLSATADALEKLHGERKRALFAGLSGTIVELGPGTGANCRHYPKGATVIGIEPNLRMHGPLAASAREHGVDLEIRGLKGERLDVASDSVDAVVCTLVLCSVDDPAAVLAEARRVLKPGGRFVFIEHVADPPGSWLRRLQDLVQPPWTWCFEGCRPNRDTASALEAAGFSRVEIDAFRVRSPFVHVAPHIAGTCIA